jgi:hypothetical protein
MIFNGHTEKSVSEINEEIFTEIQVMYADGMLGNRGIYDSLAPITAGVFNYIRPEGAPSYKPESLFPWINDYWKNPDLEPTAQEQASNALMAYMAQAKGFSKERFDR